MSIASQVAALVAPKKPDQLRKTGAAPIAPGIAEKLATAEARLTDLETQFGKFALAAETEGETGELALKDFLHRVDTAKATVGTLRAAYQAALNQAAEMDREHMAAIRSTKINATQSHLFARARAAAKLQSAIENYVSAFADLVKESEAAELAAPIRLDQTGVANGRPNYHLAFPRLRQLVELELYRVGAGTATRSGAHLAAVPGAVFDAAASVEYGNRRYLPGRMADPEQWPPILEAVKEENAAIIGYLKGEPAPELPRLKIPDTVLAGEPAKPERIVAMSDKLAAEI